MSMGSNLIRILVSWWSDRRRPYDQRRRRMPDLTACSIVVQWYPLQVGILVASKSQNFLSIRLLILFGSRRTTLSESVTIISACILAGDNSINDNIDYVWQMFQRKKTLPSYHHHSSFKLHLSAK